MRQGLFIAALLAFILVAPSVDAAPGSPYGYSDTGLALTGVACTSLGSTAGFELSGVTGWRAIASAPAGQTFTGGTATCCFRSAKLGRWMPCSSSFNLTLTSGQRDVPGPDIKTSVGYGRVKYLGSSVTLSSGSTFDMTYEVTQQ